MQQLVHAVVFGIAVTGFIGLLFWAARGEKDHSAPATDALLLRHGTLMRGSTCICVIALLIVATISVFNIANHQPGDAGKFVAIYSMLAAVWPPLRDWIRFRLEIDGDGLRCPSPCRGMLFIPWKEVDHISYFPGRFKNDGCFEVHASRRTIQVPERVPEIKQFLERCEIHLSPEQLADAKPGYESLGRSFPEVGSMRIDACSQSTQTNVPPSLCPSPAGETWVRTAAWPVAGLAGKTIMTLAFVVIPLGLCLLLVHEPMTRSVSGDQVVFRSFGALYTALVIGGVYFLAGRWQKRRPESEQGWGLCLMMSAPLIIAGAIGGALSTSIRVDSEHFEKRSLTNDFEVRFDDLAAIELVLRNDQHGQEFPKVEMSQGLNFLMKDGSQRALGNSPFVKPALIDIVGRAKARGVPVIHR